MTRVPRGYEKDHPGIQVHANKRYRLGLREKSPDRLVPGKTG
jgi:hypothetical protein